MDTLVTKAYDNWRHVVEYDGKSLLSSKQNSSSGASRSGGTMGPQNYSNSFDDQLSLPVPVPSEQASMNSGLTIGGNCIFRCNVGLYMLAHLKLPQLSLTFVTWVLFLGQWEKKFGRRRQNKITDKCYLMICIGLLFEACAFETKSTFTKK